MRKCVVMKFITCALCHGDVLPVRYFFVCCVKLRMCRDAKLFLIQKVDLEMDSVDKILFLKPSGHIDPR